MLKKQLIKLGVQREVDQFFEDKKTLDDTLFLSFVYRKTQEFPLWSSRTEAKTKCSELFMTLPMLCRSSQRATKRDPQNKALRKIIASCFDIAIRTPQERDNDKAQQLIQAQEDAAKMHDHDNSIRASAQIS